MGAMLTAGAGLLGAGSSLFGMMHGTPAQNVNLPQSFQPGWMPDAAGNAFTAAQGMTYVPNVPQQLYPQFEQAAANITSNPGAPQMLAGAQGASNLGMNAAMGNYGLGNFLAGAGMSMFPAAQQILQTGFDPQNALYGRTLQQLQEQVGASNAASGVGTSPFGAGVMNKALSDFNIDWQNNLLNREATAGSTANSMLGGIGGAVGQGAGLMAGAPGMMMNAAMLPYTAYNTIGNNSIGALQQLSAAGLNQMTAPQMQEQAFLNYLGTGNQSNQVANQTGQLGLNQANLAFNQQQTLGNNLGNSLAMLGGSMGGNSGGNSFFPSAAFMNNRWGWG